MAKRGRPPIGDAKMTPQQRKERWDVLMRNADGAVPDQPSRTPVVVYLSEAARDVLKRQREIAKGLMHAPLKDSEVVEEGLRLFASGIASPENEARQEELLEEVDFLQSKLEHYADMLQRPVPGYSGTSLRVRKQWYADTVRRLEADAAKPSPKVVADIATEAISRLPGYFMEQLAVDLDALRRSGLPLEQREQQMAKRLARYLDQVLGVARG